MYRTFKTTIAVLGFTCACLLAATAHAACGDSDKHGARLNRQAWGGEAPARPYLLPVDNGDPIVGLWHVTFTVQGNEVGPPDGTTIDNALVTWHSDGTELMNSARPPQDGDFCVGVWKRMGKFMYKLNHFGWFANDTANAPGGIGNPAGPTHLVEQITLSPDGNRYSGTFTLDAYDTLGNPSCAYCRGDLGDSYHDGHECERFALARPRGPDPILLRLRRVGALPDHRSRSAAYFKAPRPSVRTVNDSPPGETGTIATCTYLAAKS